MARGTVPFAADKLRELRSTSAGVRRRRLTLNELSERTGISSQQLLSYELGRSTPEAKQLVTLADALNVSPWRLTTVSPYDATLAQMRQVCGFTAADVAVVLKISRNTYRRIERDAILPHASTAYIDELAHIFGVRPKWIRQALEKNEAAQQRTKDGRQILNQLLGLDDGEPILDSAERAQETKRLAALIGASPKNVDLTVRSLQRELIRIAQAKASSQASLRYSSSETERSFFMRDLAEARNRLSTFENTLWSQFTELAGSILPENAWRALVDVYESESGVAIGDHSQNAWSFIDGSRLPSPSRYILPNVARTRYLITTRGISHVRAFYTKYRSLYPFTPPLSYMPKRRYRAVSLNEAGDERIELQNIDTADGQ